MIDPVEITIDSEAGDFYVSVSCVFEADNPIDAVKQMIGWLDEYRHMAGYRVKDANNNSMFIDAGDISW